MKITSDHPTNWAKPAPKEPPVEAPTALREPVQPASPNPAPAPVDTSLDPSKTGSTRYFCEYCSGTGLHGLDGPCMSCEGTRYHNP